MKDDIECLLKNPVRGNMRYVYPTTDVENIAKMIAALANSTGGKLFLGINDDGINLEVKGYSFDKLDDEKISEKLDGFNLFTIHEYIVYGLKIVEIDVLKSLDVVNYQGEVYEFYNDYHNKLREIKRTKVFISYNHATVELAEIIEKNIKGTYGFRVEISRDTQLEYRDNIDQFMQSIKKNDVIISLITKKYLESEACMYEVTELMRDEDYFKKLAFIIIDNKDLDFIKPVSDIDDLLPKIYGEQRFDYIKYWNDTKKRYAERLSNLMDAPTSVTELAAQTRRIGRITDEIGAFLDLLNKLLGQNFSTMFQDDFSAIKIMIDSHICN